MRLLPPASLCLLLLALAAPCFAAPAAAPETHHIAMHLVGKHPRIEVRIDGIDRPLSVVVDTAAGGSVIDAALAGRLGLLDGGRAPMQVQGAGGSTSAPGATRLLDLAAGGFRWKAQLLAIDLSAIAEADAPAIDGILGNDLLSRFDVRFDLPAGRLSLTPAGSLPRSACLDNAFPGRQPGLQRFTFAEAGLEDGAQRTQAIAVLDTGAAQTVLNRPAARALGIADDDARLRRRETGTRGLSDHTVDTWLYTLPGLRLGDQTLAAGEVRISALPVFATLGLTETPALILGVDALRDRRVDVLANAEGTCLGPPAPAPRGVAGAG
ncbi:aspartyl protease family protein [Luteimonas sp BLCC-B24]|uniref:aspartyl protease family protein n=1 Tax=Luteimonas sp. BLCC-B24 TaxID=3025317 RepID=UPI00234C3927|nr:aspartyl protease family protein [Luteimonas sp. BLCC-B24]MDC7808352.1 aspartyl protease family protein [Luteimonas sp. BLCC-B24]